MVINEFGALDFRNYQELFVILSDRINLIVGKNAQGKTNLAEAIHFLCHLASFRTQSLEHLLTLGETAAQVQ